MSNYTVRVQEIGGDTIYTIRLKTPHPVLPLSERQAPFDVPHVRWLKDGRASKTDWMKQRCYRGEADLCNSDQKRWDEFMPVAHYYGSLMATEWFGRRWPAHWHSALWARAYLELVKFRMGAAAGALLKQGFDKHKVRYRPYRQLTDAQRQALRDRFVARGLNRKPQAATVASEGVAHAQ